MNVLAVGVGAGIVALVSGNKSKSTYDSLYRNAFRSTTEVLNSVVNEQKTRIGVVQKARITLADGAVFDCGNKGFTLSQSAEIGANIIVGLDSGMLIEIGNQIATSMLNDLEKQMRNTTKGIALSSQVAEDITKIRQEVEVDLSSRIVNTISQVVSVDIAGSQDIVIEIGRGAVWKANGCVISQEFSIDMISNSVASSAVDFMQKNTSVTDMATKYKLTMDNYLEGIQVPGILLAIVVIVGAIVGVVVIKRVLDKKSASGARRGRRGRRGSGHAHHRRIAPVSAAPSVSV